MPKKVWSRKNIRHTPMAKYTIDDIRRRQDELKKKLRGSERMVRSSFKNVNRKPRKPQGFVSRVVGGAQDASFLLDAAFLGFKLYRAFAKKRRK